MSNATGSLMGAGIPVGPYRVRITGEWRADLYRDGVLRESCDHSHDTPASAARCGITRARNLTYDATGIVAEPEPDRGYGLRTDGTAYSGCTRMADGWCREHRRHWCDDTEQPT